MNAHPFLSNADDARLLAALAPSDHDPEQEFVEHQVRAYACDLMTPAEAEAFELEFVHAKEDLAVLQEERELLRKLNSPAALQRASQKLAASVEAVRNGNEGSWFHSFLSKLRSPWLALGLVGAAGAAVVVLLTGRSAPPSAEPGNATTTVVRMPSVPSQITPTPVLQPEKVAMVPTAEDFIPLWLKDEAPAEELSAFLSSLVAGEADSPATHQPPPPQDVNGEPTAAPISSPGELKAAPAPGAVERQATTPTPSSRSEDSRCRLKIAVVGGISLPSFRGRIVELTASIAPGGPAGLQFAGDSPLKLAPQAEKVTRILKALGVTWPTGLGIRISAENSPSPISGPSATLGLALLARSILTDVPLRDGLLVTGDLDETAPYQVQQVGGLFEKMEAGAAAAGIFLLPKHERTQEVSQDFALLTAAGSAKGPENLWRTQFIQVSTLEDAWKVATARGDSAEGKHLASFQRMAAALEKIDHPIAVLKASGLPKLKEIHDGLPGHVSAWVLAQCASGHLRTASLPGSLKHVRRNAGAAISLVREATDSHDALAAAKQKIPTSALEAALKALKSAEPLLHPKSRDYLRATESLLRPLLVLLSPNSSRGARDAALKEFDTARDLLRQTEASHRDELEAGQTGEADDSTAGPSLDELLEPLITPVRSALIFLEPQFGPTPPDLASGATVRFRLPAGVPPDATPALGVRPTGLASDHVYIQGLRDDKAGGYTATVLLGQDGAVNEVAEFDLVVYIPRTTDGALVRTKSAQPGEPEKPVALLAGDQLDFREGGRIYHIQNGRALQEVEFVSGMSRAVLRVRRK